LLSLPRVFMMSFLEHRRFKHNDSSFPMNL
jgi:hypothetical protein